MILLKNCWVGVKQQSLTHCFLWSYMYLVLYCKFPFKIKPLVLESRYCPWHKSSDNKPIYDNSVNATFNNGGSHFYIYRAVIFIDGTWENHLPVVNDKHLRKFTPLLWRNQVLNVCGDRLWSSTFICSRPWHMMADCIGASNWLTDNGFTVIKVGILYSKIIQSNKTFYILVAVFRFLSRSTKIIFKKIFFMAPDDAIKLFIFLNV